jgi:hypothetical protein
MVPTMMKPRLKMEMAAAEMLYSAKHRGLRTAATRELRHRWLYR